ncbi:hypothetical protein KBC80_02125 [Candidatus Woesebacteria bacterium]|jgi:hypothetical protein|nr:hypothetical protein [Candidatus Woesebacteria bacterium]
MKKILFIAFVLIVVGVFAVNGIGNAIDARNAAKAEQSQLEALQAQQVMDKLPDWGKTLIITIGILYGMETFGPTLLVAAAMTTLGGLVIVIIFLMQVLTLFSRPTSPEAYKYSFNTSLIIAGIVVVVGGIMIYNIPGGGALVQKIAFYAGVFGFFAMGGGFGLRVSGGKFTSTVDQNGNAKTEAEGPKVAMVVSGRGRKSGDSDVKVEWE